MSKDKWTEDHIEKRLRDMPVAKDQRTKDEIMQRLQNDPRLSEVNMPKKRPSKSKWPPIIAAVAAILLLTILVPTFLQQNHETSMDKATSNEEAASVSIESSDDATESMQSEDAAVFTRSVSAPMHYAAYPADVTDHTVFHIGLATDQATIVPVTFLIPGEQAPEDAGVADSVALYHAYANTIDEESLGFTEYHPYEAEVSADGKRVQMKFSADHAYDLSSASLEMLKLSVRDTFYGFDGVEFLQEDGSPVIFDQVGKVKEPVTVTGALSRQAYYLFVKSDGEAVLSPNFGKTSETLKEALDEMKKTPNDFYSTVVPDGVDFTVKEGKDVVKVKFNNMLDLEKLPLEEAMQLIEGIVLTAASFDRQVQFDQIVQPQWNGFDFTQPIEKPVGANPKFLINE